MFPVSPLKQTAVRPKNVQPANPQKTRELGTKSWVSNSIQRLSMKNATKQDIYSLKLRDDEDTCWIRGMALTKDGRLLFVDVNNDKVKMFSHDVKFLSSATVPHRSRDIAVICETEAAVTTLNCQLVILDISVSQLSIKTTTKLSNNVRCISR